MKFQKHQVIDFGKDPKVNFFLSKIHQSFWKWDFDKMNSQYAYISVAEARAILGYKCEAVINELIKEGFIEKIMVAKTNKYGKSLYGYIPLTFASNTKILLLNSTKNFASNYYKLRKKTFSKYGHAFLQQLRSTKFVFTEQQYLQAIKDSHKDYLKKPLKKGQTEKKNFQQYLDHHKWKKQQIEAFNTAKEYELAGYIHEDNFGLRVHTIASGMHKSLREYITLHGEQTTELDLHQSQPVLLGKMLEERIGFNSYSAFVVLYDIYTFIQEKEGLETRDQAKDSLYTFLYGELWQSEKFFSWFPDIKPEIVKIKTTYLPENPKPEKYKNLVCLMQRMETKVFRKVWDKLFSARIAFLPIHDAVLIKKKDKEKAEKVMKKTLFREIGTHIIINSISIGYLLSNIA